MSAATNPCTEFCHAVHGVGDWLYNWQTLISGMLALGAAIWAGKILREQISQAEKFRKDEIAHQHSASRVALPLALSSIDELCPNISVEIAHEFETRKDFGAAFDEAAKRGRGRSRFEPVVLSDVVISEMKGFVESLRGRRSVRHVAELMSSIQILISRYNSFDLGKGNPVVVDGLVGLLIDTAKVGLLNDNMYNYSRFVGSKFAIVGRIPNDEIWQMIHAKAEGLIFDRKIPDIFFESINEKISLRKKAQKSPWLEKFKAPWVKDFG